MANLGRKTSLWHDDRPGPKLGWYFRNNATRCAWGQAVGSRLPKEAANTLEPSCKRWIVNETIKAGCRLSAESVVGLKVFRNTKFPPRFR